MPDRPEAPAPIALREHVAGSGRLNRLVDSARRYAEDFRQAYCRNWATLTYCCRMKRADSLPPSRS